MLIVLVFVMLMLQQNDELSQYLPYLLIGGAFMMSSQQRRNVEGFADDFGYDLS